VFAAGVIRLPARPFAEHQWRGRRRQKAACAVRGRMPAGRLRSNIDRMCGRSRVVLSLSSIGAKFLEVEHRVPDGELLRKAMSSLGVKIKAETFAQYRGSEIAEREARLKRWKRLETDA
jgi:hypothetical protein